MAAYGVLTYHGTLLHLAEAKQKLNRGLAHYLVETNKLARGDPVNHRALSTLFANLMSVNPNIEIYLLDADGAILAYSAAEQRVKRKFVDLGPVRSFLGGEEMFPLLGDDPRDTARQKVFSVAPLPARGTPASSETAGARAGELFELAKLESHAEPPKREAFAVSDLLEDVAAEFRIVAEGQGVQLRTRVDEDLPRVTGDVELMERALQNLIENAIHHIPADDIVVIAATGDEPQVHVSVSDTGRGIPAHDLPRVFDRFYQARGALDNARGAGLGLAIAQRTVKLHGGLIHATIDVGVGTRFALSLPAIRSESPLKGG